ncbi:MAG TPA: aminotransferase, partial [Thermoanaerobaculia bacterium]|nr:aminotransferase [Thermoanaerobaculia bacterium]
MTRLTQEDAVAIARRLYGLAAAARPLPSERDQNFALSTERGAFVLKISGAAEKREVLDLQNDALVWLAARAPALPLPRLVPTTAGAAIAEAEGRFVR